MNATAQPATSFGAKILSRMRLHLVQFSAMDVRTILRVLLFLLAWKTLSADYFALPALITGPDINPIFPLWMNPWIDRIQAVLFDTTWKVVSLQLIAAASLLLTAWRLSRWWLWPGVGILWALQLSAAQYRFISFDYEVPLSLLVIALFWPRPWGKIFRGDTTLTSEATALGTSWAVYVAIMYHMTGLSKIYFDPHWNVNVRLDLLIPAMEVWHGTILPDWLLPIAKLQRWFFANIPYLSAAIAAMTLGLETFWPLAIISRTCRRIIPVCMFGAHLVIFLGSGILFLSMAVSALTVITPWRYLSAPLTLSYDARVGWLRQVAGILKRLDWRGRLTVVQDGLPATDAAADVAGSMTSQPVGLAHAIEAEDAYGRYAGAAALARAALRCPLFVPLGTLALLPLVRWIPRAILALLLRTTRAAASRAASENASTAAPRRGWARSFDRLKVQRLPRSPWAAAGYVGAILVAAYLGCFPAWLNTYFYPFINYRVFGWSYASAGGPMTVYRLGYYDRQEQKIKFVPMNHGGFMDFNLVSCPGLDIEPYLRADSEEERIFRARRLAQYRKAMRPYGSNRWLLGPLAHPNHVIAKSQPIPPEWFDELYLLEGHSQYDPQSGKVTINWQVKGKLPDEHELFNPQEQIATKPSERR